MAGKNGATGMGVGKLRSILLSMASVGLFGCGPDPAARRPPVAEPQASSGEPAEPSAPVVRFSAQEPGAQDVGAARLRIHAAGTLPLPDGRLAVSDALINDAPLVVPDLPTGDHAVDVLVAESASDARVAGARVRLRDEPAASWRRVGYFAVDSGTGAFFNPQVVLDPSSIPDFNDTLLKALEQSYRHTYSVVNLAWHGTTYVAFSTGMGDGAYPVYVGSSSTGSPVTVVVDCEILPWKE